MGKDWKKSEKNRKKNPGGRRAEKVLSEVKKSRAAQKVGREKTALREPNGKKITVTDDLPARARSARRKIGVLNKRNGWLSPKAMVNHQRARSARRKKWRAYGRIMSFQLKWLRFFARPAGRAKNRSLSLSHQHVAIPRAKRAQKKGFLIKAKKAVLRVPNRIVRCRSSAIKPVRLGLISLTRREALLYVVSIERATIFARATASFN